jgi:hypothetical protein
MADAGEPEATTSNQARKRDMEAATNSLKRSAPSIGPIITSNYDVPHPVTGAPTSAIAVSRLV